MPSPDRRARERLGALMWLEQPGEAAVATEAGEDRCGGDEAEPATATAFSKAATEIERPLSASDHSPPGRYVLWSEAEVSALLAGARDVGVGRWAEILRRSPLLALNRTADALRYKWRSLPQSVRSAAAPAAHAPTKRPKRPATGAQRDREIAAHIVRDALIRLVEAGGALGVGSRAVLRALLSRARPVVDTWAGKGRKDGDVYLEFSGVYVRMLAALGGGGKSGKVSRNAVDKRAWPSFREALAWEEVSAAEARKRGAAVRMLEDGQRFGRHIFVDARVLDAAVCFAGEYFGEDVGEEKEEIVEYVVDISRRPGVWTSSVAEHCPRRVGHKHGDASPSLIMWMKSDGVSGGALCPVCRNAASEGAGCRTWKVRYEGTQAFLTVPARRRARRRGMSAVRSDEEESSRYFAVSSEAASSVAASEPVSSVTASEAVSSVTASGLPIASDSNNAAGPVGGHVMTHSARVAKVGQSGNSAYVLAKLFVDRRAVGDEESSWFGRRTRTVGSMSMRFSPLKILMESDEVSKRSHLEQNAKNIGWMAKESLAVGPSNSTAVDDDLMDNFDYGRANVSRMMDTKMVSVSAMSVSAWVECKRRGNGRYWKPQQWAPVAQAWVLFDLDNVGGLCSLAGDDAGADTISDVVSRASSNMIQVVRRSVELSGVCMIVQSGPRGLHVWAQLREVRYDPRSWFKCPATRIWYEKLGGQLLGAALNAGATGGNLDMSYCSAGRFARLPSWRILDTGEAYRSRLVTVVPSRSKKRKPRKATGA